MFEKLKRIFISRKHNDAMMRREVEKFHKGIATNRHYKRNGSSRMREVKRTNAMLRLITDKVQDNR